MKVKREMSPNVRILAEAQKWECCCALNEACTSTRLQPVFPPYRSVLPTATRSGMSDTDIELSRSIQELDKLIAKFSLEPDKDQVVSEIEGKFVSIQMANQRSLAE